MKAKILLGALLFSLPIAVYADRMSAVNYECDQLDKARDGFKCKASYDAHGWSMFVRIYAPADSPQSLKDKISYRVRVMENNFFAAGGDIVRKRVNNKQGKLIETSCSWRNNMPTCNEWTEVSSSD